MSDKIYYKVLYKKETYLKTEYISCVARTKCPSLAVKYSLNDWTKPHIPHSKLFVFSDLSEALYYKAYGEVVFECEVQGAQRCTKIHELYSTAAESIVKMWSKRHQHRKYIHSGLMYPPPHTVMCDAVKLIKCVSSKQGTKVQKMHQDNAHKLCFPPVFNPEDKS